MVVMVMRWWWFRGRDGDVDGEEGEGGGCGGVDVEDGGGVVIGGVDE